jgi:hypothetical protein
MKTTQISIFMITLVTLIIMNACQSEEPVLKKYLPQNDSLFKISFDYPANWEWKASPNSRKTYEGIGIFEPYKIGGEKNNNSGVLSIEVWVDSKPQVAVQEQIDLHLKGINALRHLELLNDFVLQIDGNDARWLTRKNNESDVVNQPLIEEFIYLLTRDRYYTIILSIPESETGGRFHTEFKAMVESIKFLP